jgi:Tfp pilus assembly protein PilF
VRDAIDALKISLWSAETAEAHTVLADAYIQAKQIGQARAEADRALALDPSSTEARRLVAVLKSP